MKRNSFFEDESINPRYRKGQFKRLYKYIYPRKKVFLLVLFMMLAAVGISLIPPILIKYIVDLVIPDQNYKLFAGIIAAFVVLAAIDVLLNYFVQRVAGKNGFAIITEIRNDIYRNLQNLPFNYYDNRPSGKIVVRVTNYIDELANFFSNQLFNFVISIVRIIVVVVFMLVLNPILAAVVLAVIIPIIICAAIIKHFAHNRQVQMRAKNSNRTAFLVESIMGAKEIKSFNRTEFNEEVNMQVQKAACNAWNKFELVNNLNVISFEMFWYLGTIIVYGVSFLLMQRDMIQLGTILAFINYMPMVNEPFSTLSSVLQQLAQVTANLELVFETIETKSDITEKENAIELENVKGDIVFKDVTFGYDEGVNVLEHFNLEVQKGQTVALVGPTGSGKSTVINLLTRFYDIKEGEITIDGINIKDVTLNSLRKNVGVVMQDPFIFKGTVLENIRYGKLEASDEECIEAARKIGAESFIERLPDGYNTLLNERGEGLSGGEKQILSFARIILKNPSVFIFDEATSSIDSETELQVQSSLEKLIEGRTCFMIAHRLSTIRKADKILFIMNKGIAEQGTHAELIAKQGLYYHLERQN